MHSKVSRSTRNQLDLRSLDTLLKSCAFLHPDTEICFFDSESQAPLPDHDNHILIRFEKYNLNLVISPRPNENELISLHAIISHHLQMAKKTNDLGRETLERYKEINAIFHLSEILSQTKSLKDAVDRILQEINNILPCSYLSMWLFTRKTNRLIPVGKTTEEELCIFSTEEEEKNFLDDYLEQTKNADILKEDQLPFDSRFAPAMIIPLKSADRISGCLFFCSPKKGFFTAGDLKLSVSLGIQTSFSIQNTLHIEELEMVFDSVVRSMVAAIDERDSTTSGHSARISSMCQKFANAVNRTKTGKFADLEFSKEQLREIKYAGLLHDVGKIGVREEVLKKQTRLHPACLNNILTRIEFYTFQNQLDPLLSNEIKSLIKRADKAYNLSDNDLEKLYQTAKLTYQTSTGESLPLLCEDEMESLCIRHGNLTRSEIEEMRKHAAGTFKILTKIKFTKDLANVAKIASSHHEKLDGSGYPSGLKESEISIQAQMMCIADIYEALVDKNRPYKPPYSMEDALRIIEYEVREKKIDTQLYEIFKENIHEITESES